MSESKEQALADLHTIAISGYWCESEHDRLRDYITTTAAELERVRGENGRLKTALDNALANLHSLRAILREHAAQVESEPEAGYYIDRATYLRLLGG